MSSERLDISSSFLIFAVAVTDSPFTRPPRVPMKQYVHSCGRRTSSEHAGLAPDLAARSRCDARRSGRLRSDSSSHYSSVCYELRIFLALVSLSTTMMRLVASTGVVMHKVPPLQQGGMTWSSAETAQEQTRTNTQVTGNRDSSWYKARHDHRQNRIVHSFTHFRPVS